MITQHEIRLAFDADADSIASMSRDCIEYGLGWSWRPSRVRRSIADAATNVVVCSQSHALAGFAIMKYGEEEGHLLLLAVDARLRRRGVGSALMAWLEATARTAGLGVIRLETRRGNLAAQAFYGRLGYHPVARVRGWYGGVEDGVRFAKDLWR
ncbi:MAG: GNAT family N-acetyltransferase [Burkholderiaceae bacterium]|nr:GNAT family N-acetyltransferase [Burkholderiaceae bacterium]